MVSNNLPKMDLFREPLPVIRFESMKLISIRQATTADLPHILRHRRLMFEAMGEQDSVALEAMQASSETYFRSALQDGSYRAWLAEIDGGAIVAGVGIVISQWPGSPRVPQARRATILNMYTDPEFRRQGIARRLMLTMLDWLAEQGFLEVSLHASDFGRPLYEQLGFRTTNEMRLTIGRKQSGNVDRCCSSASPPHPQAGRDARHSQKFRDFVVRKAKRSDVTSIHQCLAVAFEPFRTFYNPEGFAETVPTHSGLQQRLATMCLFLAECESNVIGTVGCNKLNEDEGRLRGMAVLPEWQGSTVAAALLSAAEQELREEGCTRVTLDTTEPLHRAMRFYQKHGFRPSGRVGDFFGMRLHEYVKQL
jgi:GNAT superfamily N-acetyltransferase